jgi:hypothetical protein
MGKTDQELYNKLQFNRKELPSDVGSGKEVVIFTSHEGIYRQFSYYDNGTNSKEHIEQIEAEAKYIITHVIQRELNKTKRQ